MSAPGRVKVTVSDPDTGAVLEERIVANDYCIITTGNRYVTRVQVMGRPGFATHVISIGISRATPDTNPTDPISGVVGA